MTWSVQHVTAEQAAAIEDLVGDDGELEVVASECRAVLVPDAADGESWLCGEPAKIAELLAAAAAPAVEPAEDGA